MNSFVGEAASMDRDGYCLMTVNMAMCNIGTL